MAIAFNYSSTAGAYQLTADITSSATTATLNSVTGLPSPPFKLVFDPGLGSEEIVKVTNVAGATLTIERGWDSSLAVAHTALSSVRHMATAEDFRLSRQHEDATAAHGVAGAVVGTTDTQALTNKDLSDATNTFPASLATNAEVTAEVNSSVSTAVSNHAALTATHGVAGAIVGTTDTQTLSGKTINNALSVASTAASVAQKVKGAASQTANLQEWQNSAGTVLASINASGDLSAPNALTQTAGTAKRVHVETGLDGTTDTNGYATFSHGAPFTPRVCQVIITRNAVSLAYLISVDLPGATTVTARFGNWSAGQVLSSDYLGSNAIAIISWE